jgi:hypothetical protein
MGPVRLKTDIWVDSILRTANSAGAYAVLRKRGFADSGAVLIKLDYLDGTAQLLMPAAQNLLDDEGARAFSKAFSQPQTNEKIEEKIKSEQNFDPDLWVLEIEDKQGRSFVELKE